MMKGCSCTTPKKQRSLLAICLAVSTLLTCLANGQGWNDEGRKMPPQSSSFFLRTSKMDNNDEDPNDEMTMASLLVQQALARGERHLFRERGDWESMGDGERERLLDGSSSSSSSSTRPCNTEIGRIPKSELATVLQMLLSVFLPSTLVSQVLPSMTLGIKYDVAVYKVCGSCQVFFPSSSSSPPSYCQPSTYGYDANHSSIVFLPLQNVVSDAPILGQLRAVFSFHGATLNADEAPSQVWPSDLGLTLAQLNTSSPTDLANFVGNLAPSLATSLGAAAGAIGIGPDYIGFGSSMNTYNRSFADPVLYQQAAMTGWYATQQLLQNLTQSSNCTVLLPLVTTTGYSEGGFASIAATDAMVRSGLHVLSNHAGVPFLDMDREGAWVVLSYLKGYISPEKNNYVLGALAAYAGFSFSINTPGLANTGYPNQTMISPSWMIPGDLQQNVIDWFAAPNPLTFTEFFNMLPVYAPEILNINLLDLVINVTSTNNGTSPCREGTIIPGVTDKLCEAILQGSVDSILANTTVPTFLCHSPNDTIIPTFMYPDSIYSNPLVTKMNTVFGMPVSGDHDVASLLCLLPVLDMILAPSNTTTSSSELAATVLPLTGSAAQTCKLAPTPMPVATPAPTTTAPSPGGGASPTGSAGGTSSASTGPFAVMAAGVSMMVSLWMCVEDLAVTSY